MSSLETQWQLYADDDPMSQFALLRKVFRAEATDRRKAEEAAMATLRDHVQCPIYHPVAKIVTPIAAINAFTGS